MPKYKVFEIDRVYSKLSNESLETENWEEALAKAKEVAEQWRDEGWYLSKPFEGWPTKKGEKVTIIVPISPYSGEIDFGAAIVEVQGGE